MGMLLARVAMAPLTRNLFRTRGTTCGLRQWHTARKNLPKWEHLQVALFLPRIFVIDVNVIKYITSEGIYGIKVNQESSTRIY